MKTRYISPEIKVVLIAVEHFMADSGVVGNTKDYDIGYGGIDEEGEKDPASRRYKKQWDDEEEDDDY